ncbi:thymidine kinase [Frondihabitans sp. PhB188]|uniref:thymidine kinase n=1 Tax=Frondihabitans sp. PhB188 TaxID=2485200 RepID=UPI000F47A5E0|nr:thymidine kinase [Frondihabitans sp. PhB188]ROQ36733.1 thymidine kinase [Frondihabitans sp. PhB188]
MAKLYFRYGAMNSGKSTALLQAAYNYEERGQRVLLAKPDTDTRGDDQIVSRLGVTRRTDFLVGAGDDLAAVFSAARQGVRDETGQELACLLVDEAQFLSAAQVDDLLRIAVLDDIPVLAYGIRTDFQTRAFDGAARLFEVSHSLEELKTICRCGRKAMFNARLIDGAYVFDGDQVAIDGATVAYEPLCGSCYLEESGGRLA